jgi:TrmH family RNA methyltransferase
MNNNQLIDYFQKSRTDKYLAVIEGVQALKHAARFGADFKYIITCDIKRLENLLDELAPDVKDVIFAKITEVDEKTFSRLSPRPHRTKVISLATRKKYSLKDLDAGKPVVFLEDPRDLENIGAVIRVSAAADASGVLITGPIDIWHPAVLRGAAALNYALPVLNVEMSDLTKLKRPIISLDPTGQILNSSDIAKNAILVFGTERNGISKKLLNESDQIVSLPMKQGVSSLNLATSVSATLYKLKI